MEAAVDQKSLSRVLTVPNLISAARLAAVPAFAWLLLGQGKRFEAGVLLAVLGVTDWIDGYIARRFNQVTTLGKVVDPLADRVVVGVGVLCIMIDGSAPLWLCIVVLVREVLVSTAVIGLAALGGRRIDVLWVGKAGTLALMFAFPLFLVGSSSVSWHQGVEIVAWMFAVPGLVLSWAAAAMYLPLARSALADRKVGSRA